MDLQDIYSVSAHTMSLLILFRSIGSLIGAFLGMHTRDRFDSFKWGGTVVVILVNISKF